MSVLVQGQQAGPSTTKIGENLAPFNPSMKPVVETALDLLNLTERDVLYELGCGDGRVMVSAAETKPGLRCVGVEYDAEYAGRAVAAVDAAGLSDRVAVLHKNVLDVDISEATCAFVYLVRAFAKGPPAFFFDHACLITLIITFGIHSFFSGAGP